MNIQNLLRFYFSKAKRVYRSNKKTIIIIVSLEIILNFLLFNYPITDFEVDFLSQIFGKRVNLLPVNDRKIPKLIHQFSPKGKVQANEQNNVKSWIENHKNYHIVFWTENDLDKFMQNKFKRKYESLNWNDMSWDVKSRIGRYYVTFFYGGVFVDLSLYSYSSIDATISRFSCVFAREPFFHSVYHRNKKEYLDDSFFATAPKHLFISKIIDEIDSLYSDSFFNYFCFQPPCKSFDSDTVNQIYEQYVTEQSDRMTRDPEFAVFTPLSDYIIPSGWHDIAVDLKSCSCPLPFTVYRLFRSLHYQVCCYYQTFGLPPVIVKPNVDRILNANLDSSTVSWDTIIPLSQLKQYPSV